MRLDQELVKRGLCESRTEAQGLIESGNVLLNDVVVTKQTRQVVDSDILSVTARRKYVSRGGDKLEGALFDVAKANIKEFSIFNFQFLKNTDHKSEEIELVNNKIREMLEGAIALDIGSSTGGFTECLLNHGAAHVDAVDVGSDQLHSKLRNNEKISLYENTDIRNFKSEKQYDIVVADLSFISLNNIFEHIINYGTKDTNYFLLIKPQFEVGFGNTKKGIVKDEELVSRIISEYEILSDKFGLKNIKVFPCHIKGGDGNQEFFLYGVKTA